VKLPPRNMKLVRLFQLQTKDKKIYKKIKMSAILRSVFWRPEIFPSQQFQEKINFKKIQSLQDFCF